MHKELLSAALAAALTLSLAGCGSGEGADDSFDGYTVGICEQMEHVSLSEATRGFKDALVEAFGEDGVRFSEGNALGEQNSCATIIDGFIAEGVDLILANATWPLQAAASATSEIPVLGTSVTDYATALDLGEFDGVIGTNVSGTSDLVPLEDQAALIKELFPEAGTVGLLYCSGEPNSVYQVETVRAELEGMGYACEAYAFTDANDLGAVAQTACDGSDLIYIPTDNTVAANTETVANVVIPAGVPVVGGDPGICSGCGVATITCDYYELGRLTGELAAEILRGETDVSALPVQYLEPLKVYNAENCAALGVEIPEGYTPLG
ncbi:MAG TPA: ABC transporter substrate-binding protein [Candidatus Scatomorpha merdipullorum]|uniref:ABC transporter substrate-binding protein n=1 Tax=Candidatus Scatomorpha merdipullorum TaxID=2840927 RepID=A0A9D1FDD2_9FIRM|nr:ABC transporter substrate-binding protein [Candidatus Scatomorpha merdipullorum]